MQRLVQITADGSHTIAIPELEVTFHSVNGAMQESQHVFIKAALHYCFLQQGMLATDGPLNILEMGFGTGLNALLTLRQAKLFRKPVYYHTIEQFPLTAAEASGLNYAERLFEPALEPYFPQLHSSPWNQDVAIDPCFTLHKVQNSLQELSLSSQFHIVYYDAFAPRTQPELWTEEIFRKLLNSLLPGGILVTYCSKTVVRRAMQAAGFIVQKIQGPPFKREMLRAHKPISLV